MSLRTVWDCLPLAALIIHACFNIYACPAACPKPKVLLCSGNGIQIEDLGIRLKEESLHTDREMQRTRQEISLAEQVRRIKEIEAIESDSFVPQAFKSSRDAAKVNESVEIQEAGSGVTPTVKDEVIALPTAIKYSNSDALAHPSLFIDKEEAEKLWLNRLLSLRQERLMGSPVA